MFKYLKLSAEEGYPPSMYELGNSYLEGSIVNKDTYKALAWHRHACKNGFILSYVRVNNIKNKLNLSNVY
jgi:TPR repeat protein